MVASIYGERPSPCNASPQLFEAGTAPPLPRPPHSPAPLPSPDAREVLRAALAHGRPVALGDLVDLLPDHPQPLSAVLALVDADEAVIDLRGPFGPECRVWGLSLPRT
ncbi:hypothetical protein [Methylobacterium planeticum]|uniref:hypothetical protein n=1 Tax=Methylobacterium planeticum TaxID=2615211 RepID=UPI0017846FCE|nr:hypothetical protein [Methylobacterium planeticum]